MNNYWWPLMGDCVTVEERQAMADFLVTAERLTYGEEILKFEKMWERWNGSYKALFVNSGTSADYLMMAVCKYLYGWNSETEILVPAVTWSTTISSVINLGLKPVFVDVDPQTLSMDVKDASRKVTDATKAIFLTHCLGIPNFLDKLQDLAQQADLVLLEDCCEAHGACWEGKKVGNFGLASSYSFFWGHHMTTIEGGMVCTQDEEFWEIAKSMRNHGLTRDLSPSFQTTARSGLDARFTFLTPGFNFRGTETHALLGQMQLAKLDGFIRQRNRNHAAFLEILKPLAPEISTYSAPQLGSISSFCLPLVFSTIERKEAAIGVLEANGIETRPLISGNLTRQPFVQKYLADNGLKIPALPRADEVHNCALYIGNSQFVEEEQVGRLGNLLVGCR